MHKTATTPGIGGLKRAWSEQHTVEIISGLSDEEMHKIAEAFKTCMMPFEGRTLTKESHLGFSLTAAHSALFQEADLERLLKIAFKSGPLLSPDGWEISDKHGRKTIFIKADVFLERLQMGEKRKKMGYLHRLIGDFIEKCVEIDDTDNRKLESAVVHDLFCKWINTRKVDIEFDETDFHEVFANGYNEFVRPKGGYRAMRIKVRGSPMYPPPTKKRRGEKDLL
jgi:hypothetical protein